LNMDVPKDAMLLRIFFGEDDRFEHQPLYEAIVQKARSMHLAGATVLRGSNGVSGTLAVCTLQRSFDCRSIFLSLSKSWTPK